MKGDISIAEIIADSKNGPDKTILCILEKEDKPFNSFQKIKILIARIIIIEDNITYFSNLDDIADYLNSYEKEVLKRNI